MLERIWIGWLTVVLVLALVTRLVPSARRLNALLRGIVLSGVVAFAVWVTDGRLALFFAIGFILALGALVLLTITRAKKEPTASRMPTVVQLMTRPALLLGAVAGIAAECGGRWSGAGFAVGRGLVCGVAALAAGLALIVRASRK